MFLAAREDSRYGAIGGFPRAALRPLLRLFGIGQRVTRMSADGNDTATLMVGDDLAAHQVEGHGVEVLKVAHLYTTEFKAHDSRVIAASFEDIAAVRLILPAYAVKGIILMPEHTALLLQHAQPMK